SHPSGNTFFSQVLFCSLGPGPLLCRCSVGFWTRTYDTRTVRNPLGGRGHTFTWIGSRSLHASTRRGSLVEASFATAKHGGHWLTCNSQDRLLPLFIPSPAGWRAASVARCWP